MAKLASVIGIFLCYTTCIIMIKSSQLIGFVSGPSAEIACIEKQQLVQSKLNDILEQIDYTAIESAEMILEQYDHTYQDDYTLLILRDAGIISTVYVLLLVLLVSTVLTSLLVVVLPDWFSNRVSNTRSILICS